MGLHYPQLFQVSLLQHASSIEDLKLSAAMILQLDK